MEQRTTSGAAANGAPTEEFVEQWRNAAYSCFSSGHKFCREVCPVMQVTRNETHTPTAFHANIVAMEQGPLDVEDVAATTSTARSAAPASCAARTRSSPATSTASARARSTSSRRCGRCWSSTASTSPSWQLWNERTDEAHNEPVLDGTPVSQEHVADWADGLDLPVGGETILFCRLRGRVPPHLATRAPSRSSSSAAGSSSA